jgi:N4-gp56 family major capsid protein
MPGFDTLMFVTVPDLAKNTTPLTEGTTPGTKALSITTTTLATTQYGDLVEITDVAKVKSPIEIVDIASERVSQQAKESLNQIARDVIAAGGTVKYQGSNAARTDIGAGEIATAAELRKLAATMRLNKIKPMADGYFRLFVDNEVGYDLRNDTAAVGGFIDINRYEKSETLLAGELGRLEGFKIIEVNDGPTFASTVTVHASIAVGRLRAWGAGELQTMQTYHVAPGGDHNDPLAQRELVGWKVNYGTAVLKNDRYYRYESAATEL